VLTLLAGAAPASAHELMPAFLGLAEGEGGRVTVTWKVATEGAALPDVLPRLPPDWRPVGARSVADVEGGRLERWTVDAGPDGLRRGTVGFEGLERLGIDVVVRVEPRDGAARVHRLAAARPSLDLADESAGSFATFLRLGVEHILLGLDHLLFVLGLLLLVRGVGPLVKTITSFTVAHSITLAVATMGWAAAPVGPVNAAIAVSILVLGAEILRARRRGTSLTIRRPWLAAFAFGLLHGFGFASGLVDLGLAPGEVPLALLGFNVGVEVGQVAFVLVVLAVAAALRRLEVPRPAWAGAAAALAIGALGAFWALQRTAAVVLGTG
jgi:hydrogenase/urease accessory protein HupE